MPEPVRVLAFGTFDGFHAGHRSYLRQARQYGDVLTVIVARDATVRRLKGRLPVLNEDSRVEQVKAAGIADRVSLGGTGDPLAIFATQPVDVVVLGYDQRADPDQIRQAAARYGYTPKIVRARPFIPLLFHSSFLRKLGWIGRLLWQTKR